MSDENTPKFFSKLIPKVHSKLTPKILSKLTPKVHSKFTPKLNGNLPSLFQALKEKIPSFSIDEFKIFMLPHLNHAEI